MIMHVLLAALAALLLASAPASAATIPVPPGGNLSAAYQDAQAGDVIELSTGQYGSWSTPTGAKAITVRAAIGARPVLRQLDNNASNITFDGLHVDAGNTFAANRHAALYETGGNPNVVFRNGSIGNVIDQKGAVLGGWSSTASLGTVIDNVDFYNVRHENLAGPDVHNECIFSQAPGLIVRNSTFDSTCGSTGAIFVLRGDWWGQPPYGTLTFENNTFERQLYDHGSIIFANACPTVCDRVTLRGNTFHPASMPNTTSARTFTNSVASCNTPEVSFSGMTVTPCTEPTPTPSPTPTVTATATPSPTPTATPEPTPPPEPGYAPGCAPTCDELIADLRADVAAHEASLAGIMRELGDMTDSRDDWKVRALEVGSWRDRWKTRALDAERQLGTLPDEVDALKARIQRAVDALTG